MTMVLCIIFRKINKQQQVFLFAWELTFRLRLSIIYFFASSMLLASLAGLARPLVFPPKLHQERRVQLNC